MIRPLLILSLLPSFALAQVSVNPGALDGLKPSTPQATPAPAKPADAKPARRPSAKPPSHPQPAARPASAKPPATKPGPTKPPAPVRVAPAPPPVPVLPPPVIEPARPVPPPVPPVAVPDAAGEASSVPGGVRITFGPGKADLNAQTEAAIRTLARSLAADASADLNVYAYAGGNADDPSTPRRLSLSRALAVRAVLISEGIASTRIYVRALGAPANADGPADRIDLTRNGTP